MNSSKKCVKFFSSGYYFPSSVSPLMYIFNTISIDGKLTQLQVASSCVFDRQKIVVVLVPLIDKFLIF